MFTKLASYAADMLCGEVVDESVNLPLEEAREKCRKGNPFPLVAMQFPEFVIPQEHPHYEIFKENLRTVDDQLISDSMKAVILDPSNPVLRADWWQQILWAAAFDPAIGEIALAGGTSTGKGFASALAVNLWYDVYSETRIYISGPNEQKCIDNVFGEIIHWRDRQTSPSPSEVNSKSIYTDRRHYISVLNPDLADQKAAEKFSGAHGANTLYLFDEATVFPNAWVENARRNARLIWAVANPRSLSGWFRDLFKSKGYDDARPVQVVPGNLRMRLCMQIGGSHCINVKMNRLRAPIAPKGGIVIDGKLHP